MRRTHGLPVLAFGCRFLKELNQYAEFDWYAVYQSEEKGRFANLSLKTFASRENRIALSSTLLDYATGFAVINAALYILLWLMAWQVGAISVSADFFGIRGPWCETFFLSTFMSSDKGFDGRGLFCTFCPLLLILSFVIMIPLFATTLAGLIIKPGWKGVLLLGIAVAMWKLLQWHLAFID